MKFYEALEVVVYIALHPGSDPVSSNEICSKQSVLPRHLEPVLKNLVKHNILKGTKGPKGGYTLVKEKRKLTIEEIYRAFVAPEIYGDKAKKSQLQKAVIIPLYQQINDNTLKMLRAIKLEDLCKKTKIVSENTVVAAEFNI
jgi:Rrf2 family iron-sulfur cluster assembly transcriptional regulator